MADVGDQNFVQLRQAMVASQLRTVAVNDPRVVAAMATVPRERFVPPARAALAYLDVAQPIGPGRWLPAAMVTGRLLTEARVRPMDRALVVGAGTGYSAAVLSLLTGPVVALEDEPSLVAIGVAAQMPEVRSVAGPLAAGWAESAPYDLILFDGAIEHVPAAIVAQVTEGGRVAAPILSQGVTRLAIGRVVGGQLSFKTFADAEAPVLPGFALPHSFQF